MNEEMFKAFLEVFGNNISALPKNPLKKEWQKIVDSIAPHYYGTIPQALEETFPNEDAEVFNYRRKTYQPKTEACIVDAVNNISRTLAMSKHSVTYANAETKTYIETEKKIENEPLVSYFLNKFVQNRILDPNAVLVVDVKKDSIIDTRTRVDIDLLFVESKEILFIDQTLNILIYEAPSNGRYTFKKSVKYKIVTDVFYGEIYEVENNKMQVSVYYVHNLGFLPLVVLGGRAITRKIEGHSFTYYKSDISSAIPYLNDAATADNQHKSVVNANCYPTKVLNGIECPSCVGNGWVLDETPENPDGRITCKTCKGAGDVVYTSPLKAIILRKPKGINDANAVQPPPLEYISPNVDTISLVGAYADAKMAEAKEVLNIDKAVKYAQSGIAKQIDKEPQYINIKKISDDVYMKLNHILYAVQGIVFIGVDGIISVIPPSSFDLKTESDLFAEFKATIESKAPDFVREAAYMDWLKSRFYTDTVGQRIGKICVFYASVYLFTIEERKEMFLMGTVKQDDLIKATYVFTAVLQLYDNDNMFIFEPYDVIFAKIDEFLRPRFEVAANPTPPEPDPTLL